MDAREKTKTHALLATIVTRALETYWVDTALPTNEGRKAVNEVMNAVILIPEKRVALSSCLADWIAMVPTLDWRANIACGNDKYRHLHYWRYWVNAAGSC